MTFRNSVSLSLLRVFALCKSGATAVEYTIGAMAIGIVAVSASQNLYSGIRGTATAELQGMSIVQPYEAPEDTGRTPACEGRGCDGGGSPPPQAWVYRTGTSGNDTLTGASGDDTFEGKGGADTLIGNAGFDIASYETSTEGVKASLDGSVVCQAYEASTDGCGDTFQGIEALTGTQFDDELAGDAQGNTIRGLGGSDKLYGRDGNDSLYGGEGNDSLYGENGGDELYGDNGNDMLNGGAGNDILVGGDGDDFFNGGLDADNIQGGNGVDTATYEESLAGININFTNGTSTGGDAQGDTFSSIENIYGSAFQDFITMNDGNNRIDGGDGNDYLYGMGGSDTINGGNGNDTLYGGTGSDTLNGGNGQDWVYYDPSASGMTVNLATGSATGDGSTDSLISIERVYGSRHNDVLTGDSADNYLSGNLGDDTLEGGGGSDVLEGGDGNDTYVFDGIAAQGTDYVNEGNGPNTPQNDAIRFTNAALTAGGLSFAKSDANQTLVITYPGGTLRVINISGVNYRVETIQFGNGTSCTINYSGSGSCS